MLFLVEVITLEYFIICQCRQVKLSGIEPELYNEIHTGILPGKRVLVEVMSYLSKTFSMRYE
jgi:hypothetical protein